MTFMAANGLKMNPSKTELLIFVPRRNFPVQLSIGGLVVKEADHFRVLGLMISNDHGTHISHQ